MCPADLGLQGMRVEAAKAKKGGNRDQERTGRKRIKKGPSSCRERDRQTNREKWNPKSSYPSNSAFPKSLPLELFSREPGIRSITN